MQNQTQNTETKHVADIIKVMNGGVEFYEKAKQEVDSPRIQHMFDKMVEAKKSAINELQPFVSAEKGHIEAGSDLEVSARQVYTKLLDKVTQSSTEHTYVDQLEEVEDKVLAELEEALKLDQPSGCEQALRAVQARMRECHDEMKALQMTTH